MPAPWTSDPTKDATLSALASSLSADAIVHSDTAWAMVRGESGFEDADSSDDLFYVRYNWPGVSGQALAKKKTELKEEPKAKK